ncbi:hypothetical protein ACFP76_08660 [Paracoccus aerius]|uniref:hypothetical protein n=1 Tax=Paracoccus aerius TaxID=1915382 RepID=UPI003613DF5E
MSIRLSVAMHNAQVKRALAAAGDKEDSIPDNIKTPHYSQVKPIHPKKVQLGSKCVGFSTRSAERKAVFKFG